jgi:hypothetical protein
MAPTGYCSVNDVRLALRSKGLPGDVDQDREIAISAIAGQTEWLEKNTKRHWYIPGGVGDDPDGLLPTAPQTRDDEEDIPTAAAFVVGDSGPKPRTAQGDYAKVDLARRDAESIEALHVRTADGTYEDWVASSDYTEGSWPPTGEDYYLRVNNGGVSRVYLDTTNFLKEDEDDEYVLDSFANVVYISWTYGYKAPSGDDPKLQNIRRGVALRAGATLAEEAVIEIPQNATLYNVETKAEEMRERAAELLDPYMVGE